MANEKSDFGLDSLRNIFPLPGILKALKKKKMFSLEFRNFNRLILAETWGALVI